MKEYLDFGHSTKREIEWGNLSQDDCVWAFKQLREGEKFTDIQRDTLISVISNGKAQNIAVEVLLQVPNLSLMNKQAMISVIADCGQADMIVRTMRSVRDLSFMMNGQLDHDRDLEAMPALKYLAHALGRKGDREALVLMAHFWWNRDLEIAEMLRNFLKPMAA